MSYMGMSPIFLVLAYVAGMWTVFAIAFIAEIFEGERHAKR